MGTGSGSEDVSMVPPEAEFPRQQPALPSEKGTLSGREVKKRKAGEHTSVTPLPPSSQTIPPKFRAAKRRKQETEVPQEIRPGQPISPQREREGSTESAAVPLPPSRYTPTPTRFLRARRLRQEESPIPKMLLPESDVAVQGNGTGSAPAVVPSTARMSLSQLELHLQTLLSSPEKGIVPEAIVKQCLQEGERQMQTLLSKGRNLKAIELAEKLLQVDPGIADIKFQLLIALQNTANRNKFISYSVQLMNDPSLSVERKITLGKLAFTYCFNCKEFPKAIELGYKLLAIIPDSEKAAFEANIKKVEENSSLYTDFNDPSRHSSPLPGISRDQLEILTLLSTHLSLLTPEQLSKFNDFLSFCIGNEELSKKLQAASSTPSRLAALSYFFTPLALSRMGEQMEASLLGSGAKILSAEKTPLSLAKLAKQFSILCYKTQQKNTEKYIRALEKLAVTLEKTSIHREVEAFKRIEAALIGATGSISEIYTLEEIADARQKLAHAASSLNQHEITQDDKLTGEDLTALNSLIKLKDTLNKWQSMGYLTNNLDVVAIIVQGTRAEALVGKLLTLLGEGYQSGDLCFRNNPKFEALTGKDLGRGAHLYGRVARTSFGHASMIDRTMDEEALSYSEVLGTYTYRPIPLEDFLTTDTYRLSVSSLLMEEGKNLVSARLENLKQVGLVHPLVTVDQYIQEIYLSHLETILAGPEITEEPSSELELPPAPILQKKLDEQTQILREALTALPAQSFMTLQKAQAAQKEAEIYLQHREAELRVQEGSPVDTALIAIARKRVTEAREGRENENRAVETILKDLGLWEKRQKIEEIQSQINLVLGAPAKRMEQATEYHQQAFGTIRNDGMLQQRAGLKDLFRPLTKKSEGIDFKNIKIEGDMICSQFQALATLKALAQTRDTLYEMMAEQASTQGKIPEVMVKVVPPSGTEKEAQIMSVLTPKTPEGQQAYDAALAEVRAKNLFTIPVSQYERPEMLTPRRVSSLLKKFLAPVPMAPIAREILDIPEEFFGTALFGTPQEPVPMEQSS